MIAFERIVDWVLEASSPSEAEAVEEHLMACDACTTTATRLLEMRGALVEMARAGQIRHVATPSLVAKMETDQLDLRRYRIAPGQTVPCRATATQAYAITTLVADLDDIVSLDATATTEEGAVLATISDLPFSPQSGTVVLADSGDLIRSLPRIVLRLSLVGTTRGGERRELGTYRLDHKPMESR